MPVMRYSCVGCSNEMAFPGWLTGSDCVTRSAFGCEQAIDRVGCGVYVVGGAQRLT
jgi:hypothetical protein